MTSLTGVHISRAGWGIGPGELYKSSVKSYQVWYLSGVGWCDVILPLKNQCRSLERISLNSILASKSQSLCSAAAVLRWCQRWHPGVRSLHQGSASAQSAVPGGVWDSDTLACSAQPGRSGAASLVEEQAQNHTVFPGGAAVLHTDKRTITTSIETLQFSFISIGHIGVNVSVNGY